MFMKGSRLVAREFAADKGADTYYPATGCHTANIPPVRLWWGGQKQGETEGIDEKFLPLFLC